MRITSIGLKKIRESRDGEWFEVLLRQRDGQWFASPDHSLLLEDDVRTVLRAWRLSHERVTSLLSLARNQFAGLIGG